MQRLLLVLVVLCSAFAIASAQETPPAETPRSDQPAQGGMAVVVTPPAPTTKLETLQRREGAVMVRGFTDVAGLRADDGSTIRVLAVELNDLTNKEKSTGVAIEVRPSRSGERVVLSFIDEDEISNLLTGLETLSKIDHSVTTLADFEARYRTRGMLELANTEINGNRWITITATQILPANAQLIWATAAIPLSRSRELQQQLAAARDTLTRTKP